MLVSAALTGASPLVLAFYAGMIICTILAGGQIFAAGSAVSFTGLGSRAIAPFSAPLLAAQSAITEVPLAVMRTELYDCIGSVATVLGYANSSWALVRYDHPNRTGVRPGISDEHARRCETLRAEQAAGNKSAFCDETKTTYDKYAETRNTFPMQVLRFIALGCILYAAVIGRHYISAVFNEIFGTIAYIVCDVCTRFGVARSNFPFFMSSSPTFSVAVIYGALSLVATFIGSVAARRPVAEYELLSVFADKAEEGPVNATKAYEAATARARVGGAPLRPIEMLLGYTNQQAVTFVAFSTKRTTPTFAAARPGYGSLNEICDAARAMLSRGFLEACETGDRAIVEIATKAPGAPTTKAFLTLVYNARNTSVASVLVGVDCENYRLSLAEVATLLISWTKPDGTTHAGSTDFAPFSPLAVQSVVGDAQASTAAATHLATASIDTVNKRLDLLAQGLSDLVAQGKAAQQTATQQQAAPAIPIVAQQPPAPAAPTAAAPAALYQAPGSPARAASTSSNRSSRASSTSSARSAGH